MAGKTKGASGKGMGNAEEAWGKVKDTSQKIKQTVLDKAQKAEAHAEAEIKDSADNIKRSIK